jgi:hypothetical protein
MNRLKKDRLPCRGIVSDGIEKNGQTALDFTAFLPQVPVACRFRSRKMADYVIVAERHDINNDRP